MKLIILLGVVVIVGFLFIGKGEVPVGSNTPATTVSSSDVEQTLDETAIEEAHEMDTMEVGNDAGMEFPTIDDMSTLIIDANAKIFEVSGTNFAYDVTEIKVKEGDTVVINFTSADGFHDLIIDEFSAATAKIQTGGKTSVTFVADKKGTFEYYCSVGRHRENGMVGNLIVE